MRNIMRPLLKIFTAAAALSGCGVDVVPTGDDERGAEVEPTIVTKTADVTVASAPLENAFASCEWLEVETFPSQIVGHCKWKAGCDGSAALPLPLTAPAPLSIVVTSADETLSGFIYDAERRELVLAPDACPKAGAEIEVRFTNAVQARMADKPTFVYDEEAHGCGLAQVQLRSALPLETGARAETLDFRVDLEALAIAFPTSESLAQDVVHEFALTGEGPVEAVIKRLAVGTPDRLFSNFCKDEQADDATLLATWVAVAGVAKITVHKELLAPSQFLLTVDLEGAVFRLQGQDTLSTRINVHMQTIQVGAP